MHFSCSNLQLNYSFFEFAIEQPLYVLTRHSTQMPQNGSRVIGEDSEVPSMSEEKIREVGQCYSQIPHLRFIPVAFRLTRQDQQSCNRGKLFCANFKVNAVLSPMSYLLWKWLWLSCGESAAMCTGVHLPTMHRHMAVSLLHNPPVLFLQEQERKESQSVNECCRKQDTVFRCASYSVMSANEMKVASWGQLKNNNTSFLNEVYISIDKNKHHLEVTTF